MPGDGFQKVCGISRCRSPASIDEKRGSANRNRKAPKGAGRIVRHSAVFCRGLRRLGRGVPSTSRPGSTSSGANIRPSAIADCPSPCSIGRQSMAEPSRPALSTNAIRPSTDCPTALQYSRASASPSRYFMPKAKRLMRGKISRKSRAPGTRCSSIRHCRQSCTASRRVFCASSVSLPRRIAAPI